ncbi:Vgb family protein [Brasilonema octagenarum]|uniref:PEP-CTERM sorting domain-containing protein n=1 Tax=Brasilonema octagenarum UFV-OR1 TaxID=417115 RepID=A0ABX1M8Y2_9CYAN|nr:PEP-CTERM sorting domain-containing protein [Brasilonema octagenarum]NMF65045.1 PEP-CTERM sorting domain-containing protein [Brasilonema octagenarum UFV-OR1]
MNNKFATFAASVVVSGLSAFGLGLSPASAVLLIGNTRGDNVIMYDEQNGNFLGEFVKATSGGLKDPDDLNFGPDGNFYVSSGTTPETSAILRYNGKTGEFIDVFASGNGLIRPYGAAFGPDGYLYVASFLSDEILRFNATTGVFVDKFAQGNGQPGGLNGPNDLLLGPDGSLYVTTQGSVAVDGVPTFPGLPSQVLRFDLATKTSTVFIEQPTPLPDSPQFVSLLGLTLGSKGDLFVSDFANGIRRYDFKTGQLLDVLSTNYTNTPSNNFIGNLTIDPNNILYTVGFDTTNNNFGAILRYDEVTGNPLPAPSQSGSVFVPTNSRLLRPVGITYASITVPEPASTVGLLSFGALYAVLLLKRKCSQVI